MKKITLLFSFCFATLITLSSQEYLIIEQSGRLKNRRISQYEILTFKLKDDNKGWYHRQILDLNTDANLILLGDTWVPIKEIKSIKVGKMRTLATIVGNALQRGGVSFLMGDAFYTLKGKPEFTQGGLESGFASIALGTALKKWLSPVKYNFNQHTRLRIIDLTYGTTKQI